MNWEYFVLTYTDVLVNQALQDNLDHLGSKGWELIFVDEDLKTFIFKRPILSGGNLGGLLK